MTVITSDGKIKVDGEVVGTTYEYINNSRRVVISQEEDDMVYVVKMNGEKVRSFNNLLVANAWAKKHCHGKIEIVNLSE